MPYQLDNVLYDDDGNAITETQLRAILDASPEYAEEVARAEIATARQVALTAPIAPLPIEGATVAEVKASAETAIADLATQMQAKIDAILGNS